MEFDDFFAEEEEGRPPDPALDRAVEELRAFFDARRERVFYSRQVEVLHERTYFHWITNRAVKVLQDLGLVVSERRPLRTGGSIQLLWYRGFRYYRRSAKQLVRLVEEYSDPNIGAALGLQGEALVLEGFAREQFVLHGRNTRTYQDRTGSASQHDLDFIFVRDGRAYGVEVKNTLGYMDHHELAAKIQLCSDLGMAPVFVARMLPKTWVREVVSAGGFALLLGYQLYPWAHKSMAERLRRELELPVDAPRALAEGTMRRFVSWHERELRNNSHPQKHK